MLTMYDSVDVGALPAGALAVAGYVDGHWPTFPAVERAFPHAHRLSIATRSSSTADCLDVENHDASIGQAPAWIRARPAGGRRPVIYVSLWQAQSLIDHLGASGIPRGAYRIWTAHYTGRAHLCSPGCGLGFHDHAGATQYTNRAFGRNLDASLVGGVAWFGRHGP